MGWLDLTVLAAVLGTTVTPILLGPRLWQSESTRRARRLADRGTGPSTGHLAI